MRPCTSPPRTLSSAGETDLWPPIALLRVLTPKVTSFPNTMKDKGGACAAAGSDRYRKVRPQNVSGGDEYTDPGGGQK